MFEEFCFGVQFWCDGIVREKVIDIFFVVDLAGGIAEFFEACFECELFAIEVGCYF